MLETGVNYKGLTLKADFETLGSENGVVSFKTPLATLHKFKSDFANMTFGSEIDISVSKKIFDQVTVLLKYTKYNAATLATDTSKFWIKAGARF